MTPLGFAAALLLGIGLLGGFILWQRRAQRGVATNKEGVALLNQGRLSQALEKFELAAEQTGEGRALMDYNVGLTRLYLWRLEPALEALARASQQLKAAQRAALPLAELTGLAEALLGRIDQGEKTLDRESPAGTATGLRMVAEAVIAARPSSS